MVLEELGGVALLFEDILVLGEAVPLILVDVVADIDTSGTEVLHDLVALTLGHTRVVRPLNHEQRRPNLVGVGDGRPREQELAFGLRITDQIRTSRRRQVGGPVSTVVTRFDGPTTSTAAAQWSGRRLMHERTAKPQ